MKLPATRTLASRKGQSIIEALVAIAILSVGLMGVLALLSRSIYLQRVASDNTTATYLASEGLEVAKSLIDHGVYVGVANKQETNGWNGALTGCFNFSANGKGTYEMDFTTVNCSGLSSGSGQLCTVNGNDGATYYYDCDNPLLPANKTRTNFYRTITVSRSSNNTSMDVISKVTWSSGAITGQSLTLEDTFYNWHP